MKRLIVFLLIIALFLPLFSTPIFATDAETADNKQWDEGWFEFLSPLLDLKNFLDVICGEVFGYLTTWTTLGSGGYNYAENNGLNKVISVTYGITYTIGFAIMLLSWGFNMASGTITSALDIKDKSSLIRSVMSLVIGIAAIVAAPQILTVLTSVSRWLCNEIWMKVVTTASFKAFNTSITDYIEQFNEYGFSGSGIFSKILSEVLSAASGSSSVDQRLNNYLYMAIVGLIIDLIFILNILWLALLQALSPIFIAFFGGEKTRKIAMNFIKEYFKALLVAPVTLIYLALAISVVTNFMGGIGLIGALVLAISTLGIAGKKLDKLIN